MNCTNCARYDGKSESASNYIKLSNGNILCPLCFAKEQPLEVPKHDPVNHPKHYTSHPSGVECITITRHMTFNIGNAIKYLWRCSDKDNQIQDLEKAVWYIKDEINRLKK